MERINSYGARRAPEDFIGTEASMTAMTDMVPGDKFYTEDQVNNKMLAGYLYTGTGWRVFERYDV